MMGQFSKWSQKTQILVITVITLGTLSGIAYAAVIDAPEIPRFGDSGSDNVITSGERSGFQIIFNFTASGPIDTDIVVGDRLYILNGTDSAAANFTSPVFKAVTQEEINQKSMNFTSSQLSGLGDGNYILRGQWLDVSAGEGGTVSSTNESGTLTLDSNTPTVTITSSPSSPASTKTSLTFNFEFSEPVTGFSASDLTIDFNGGGFSAVGGSLTTTDSNTYSYTLTASELDNIEDGKTVTIRVGTGIQDTNSNSLSQTDFAWTYQPSSSGGSGCNGDCEEPTLGVLPNGQRVVEDGFTYNGHSVDVERFFTPYPLITAEVGKQNTAQFKIYENRGPDNIAHFDFAFGLGKDQIISDSKAMIEVDFARDGTQTVNIVDPENTLDNVSVTTDKVACNGGPTQCLEITINHTFREPLDFNIVATNVWDYSRQSWQNYYNHGIEVVGTSMNPAKQYDGINQGNIYHLTETGKNTAVDEFGDSWTFQYGIWMKDYIKQDRIQDGETIVFDRMHSDFAEYREHLANDAFNQLSETCPLCIEQYADFEGATSWEYGNKISKLSNSEIQMLMSVEEQKAQEIMKRLLDVKYDLRNAYLGIENDDRPIAEILEEERINKIILQAERTWLKQVIAPNQ